MPTRKSPAAALKAEKQRQKLDKCAIAAAEMILGEYPYQKGEYHVYDKEHNETYNCHVLNRIYNNNPDSDDYHFRYEKDPYFVKRLKFELWRRQDPRFRHDQMSEVWSRIIDGTIEALFERVELRANGLSTNELLKILDLGVKVGEVGRKLNDTSGISGALQGLDPAKRKALLEETAAKERQHHERKMKLLEEIGDAHDGADLSGV